MTVQMDWTVMGKSPGYADKVRERATRGVTGKQAFLSVPDVASILGRSCVTVRNLIEEGRILGVNVNAGRVGEDGAPMKPFWTVTHEALYDFADRVEKGI